MRLKYEPASEPLHMTVEDVEHGHVEGSGFRELFMLKGLTWARALELFTKSMSLNHEPASEPLHMTFEHVNSGYVKGSGVGRTSSDALLEVCLAPPLPYLHSICRN